MAALGSPLPSIYYPDFIAANQEARADNVVPGTDKQAHLEHIVAVSPFPPPAFSLSIPSSVLPPPSMPPSARTRRHTHHQRNVSRGR